MVKHTEGNIYFCGLLTCDYCTTVLLHMKAHFHAIPSYQSSPKCNGIYPNTVVITGLWRYHQLQLEKKIMYLLCLCFSTRSKTFRYLVQFIIYLNPFCLSNVLICIMILTLTDIKNDYSLITKGLLRHDNLTIHEFPTSSCKHVTQDLLDVID